MPRSARVSSFPHIPPAPWQLSGAALVLPHRRGALLLVHYESSPVGPYDELAVATLKRSGPTVVRMLVSREASREGGRHIWGFPKETTPLKWTQTSERVRFQGDRKTWRARAIGPRLPVKLRAWTVQNLRGERVRVPFHIGGTLRLAWCGKMPCALLEDMMLRVDAPLRAPLKQ